MDMANLTASVVCWLDRSWDMTQACPIDRLMQEAKTDSETILSFVCHIASAVCHCHCFMLIFSFWKALLHNPKTSSLPIGSHLAQLVICQIGIPSPVSKSVSLCSVCQTTTALSELLNRRTNDIVQNGNPCIVVLLVGSQSLIIFPLLNLSGFVGMLDDSKNTAMFI